MLKRMGKNVNEKVLPIKKIHAFQKVEQGIRQWATKQKNVDILYVKYSDVIQQPMLEAIKINE